MGDGTNNAYNNQPVVGDDFGGGGIVLTNQNFHHRGGTGTIASGTLGLVNNGTINANVPVGANSLLLNVCCEGTSGIVNNGIMEASRGRDAPDLSPTTASITSAR